MDSFFYKLLEDELKPATGCTEPIAIAYAASLAFEHTDRGPVKRVEITASVNVIKNAMGVTIPVRAYMVYFMLQPLDYKFRHQENFSF